MRYFILLLLSYFILFGCASNPIPIVSRVPVPDIIALPPNLSSRPLLMDRVMIDVPKGTVLGEKRQGTLCVRPAPLTWEEDILEFNRGGYHKEFEKIAKQYNFRLAEKPTSLFGSAISTGNELLIAARIVIKNQNACFAVNMKNIPIRKGNVLFSVQWEIFSVEEKKVVFVFKNEGSGVLEDFKPFGEDSYYVEAFGNALRGLFNDEGFRTLVSSIPSGGGKI